MKKFLSTILAVVMVLSSIAMVVSAEDANIPTSNGIWANGVQYSSIDAAAASLSSTGGTIYVYGTVEVGSRQTIAYDGITLEGLADGALVASDNFVNASETNRKAVLTVTATGTTNIKNLTVDGTNYDNTLATASTFSFKVVRINDGTVNMNNVTISGSKAGLLQVGTETTDAIVNADGLYANAVAKSIADAKYYADVLVANGEFNMTNGLVEGFIATDKDTQAGEIDVDVAGYFTFNGTYLTQDYVVCTTPNHIQATYNSDDIDLSLSDYNAYLTALTSNNSVTESMMRYVRTNAESMANVKTGLNTMLDDMIGKWWSYGSRDTLQNYKDILNGVVE